MKKTLLALMTLLTLVTAGGAARADVGPGKLPAAARANIRHEVVRNAKSFLAGENRSLRRPSYRVDRIETLPTGQVRVSAGIYSMSRGIRPFGPAQRLRQYFGNFIATPGAKGYTLTPGRSKGWSPVYYLLGGK